MDWNNRRDSIDENNGQVVKVLTSETESLFSNDANGVHDIQENKNNIWISTADGLFSIQKKGNDIIAMQKHDLKKDYNYSTNQFGFFKIDSKGQFWICTLNGLVIYNPYNKELYHADNNPSSLKILKEKKAFQNLWIDEGKKTIIYSTWEPAVRIFYQEENKTSTIYSAKRPDNPDYETLITAFLKDNHGTLWMATEKGIKTIGKQGSEKHIHSLPNNSYSLINNRVTALLQNKEGSVWAGTAEGISITQPYKQSFFNISNNNVSDYAFASSDVKFIIPVDANSFLIGTGNGVFRTDATFKVLKHYLFGTSDYDWIWKSYRHGSSIYISAQKGNQFSSSLFDHSTHN